MNLGVFSGKVCSVPKTSILQFESGFVCVCKFILATYNSEKDEFKDCSCDKNDMDFFECFAVGDTAKIISEKFPKWSKIVVRGLVKNFVFQDINNIKHFTNFIFVEQVYNEDEESIWIKAIETVGLNDKEAVAALKENNKLYKEICDNNYLCIDEDDYYNIATMSVH